MEETTVKYKVTYGRYSESDRKISYFTSEPAASDFFYLVQGRCYADVFKITTTVKTEKLTKD